MEVRRTVEHLSKQDTKYMYIAICKSAKHERGKKNEKEEIVMEEGKNAHERCHHCTWEGNKPEMCWLLTLISIPKLFHIKIFWFLWEYRIEEPGQREKFYGIETGVKRHRVSGLLGWFSIRTRMPLSHRAPTPLFTSLPNPQPPLHLPPQPLRPLRRLMPNKTRECNVFRARSGPQESWRSHKASLCNNFT